MRKIVKDVCATAWIALGICALASPAGAQDPQERELRRWVPAFGFVVGVAANRFEGHINTTDVLGPQIPPLPNGTPRSETRLIEGSPVTDRTALIVPTFGASLELMTPGWRRLPGSPRAFGRIDLTYNFGPEYNTPNLGAPGEFIISGEPVGVSEGRILGQGARLSVQGQPFVLTAGGGVAFTLRVDDRALRVKPSFEYMRHEVQMQGVLRRVVQVAAVPGQMGLEGFRQVSLFDSEKRLYHWIGPGIEFDFDATRAGDFIISPYLSLKSWVVLGNDKVVLTDANEFNETAIWTYLPNRWAFGGTVGVRVRWSPE